MDTFVPLAEDEISKELVSRVSPRVLYWEKMYKLKRFVVGIYQDLKQPKLPMITFLESPRLYTPEKSFEEEGESTESKKDILEELKTWRFEYSK